MNTQFSEIIHSLHKTEAGEVYLSCRQLPALSSQHLTEASKDVVAPGLCVLGKWLRCLYKHGAEKQREVAVSN